MKIAIVLMGNMDVIVRQAKELNGFIRNEMSEQDEIEAWILSDGELNLQTVPFSSLIKRVKLCKVQVEFVSESFLDALEELYEVNPPQLMLFAGDGLSAGVSARAAFRFHGSSTTSVRNIGQQGNRFVIEKLCYSNNLVARFALKRPPYCISIAKGLPIKPDIKLCLPPIENVPLEHVGNIEWLYSLDTELVESSENLTGAKTVVAIGQGIGSKEKVALLRELASLLGGELGASRAVVMNAWLGMEHLIGASGAMIAPELCIAIGVSGAAAFSVGIEKSKFIVAINRDPQAPIYKIADVGICADYEEIVPELIKILNDRNAVDA